MVVLGPCLLLVLAAATLGQDQEFDKIIKNLDKLVQEKKHNEVVKENFPKKFSNLGKFRQAVIGSEVKYGQRATPPTLATAPPGKTDQKKHKNLLLERFRALTQQKVEKGEATEKGAAEDTTEDKKPANSEAVEAGKDVVDQLHSLVTTGAAASGSTAPPAPSTSLATPAEPLPLGLTTNKRSAIHDLPEGDGVFLVVVVCIAGVCILGVVGVGYCVHHPTCPRATSPFSDSSPSFHSAQLAFSASPEQAHHPAHTHRSECPGGEGDGGGEGRRTDARTSPASRAHKFRSVQEGVRGTHTHSGVQRMESLIDIGPEEEEEDDMIYECPGLAPHGEMEVTNPFFLSKGLDLNLEGVDVGKMTVSPCPVNNNNNMRHGNIHRNIQPGQQ